MNTKPDYSHAKMIISSLEEGKVIQHKGYNGWGMSALNDGNASAAKLSELNEPNLYRVAPEPEYIPLTAEDIPAVCWVTSDPYNPIELNAYFVGFLNYHSIKFGCVNLTFKELMEHGYHYSEDRKDWKLCRKEKV